MALHPRIQPTAGAAALYIVHFIERSPVVSGPAQFKLLFFKGQLYMQILLNMCYLFMTGTWATRNSVLWNSLILHSLQDLKPSLTLLSSVSF